MEERAFDCNQEKLTRYFHNPSSKLRNEIVLDNQELVWYIVKRYTSGIATRDDMFQAGIVGLITAIERFDPERGAQLSTYAVPYIQNEIRKLIDNPDYIEDHAGLEPADHYEDNPRRSRLGKLYESILSPDERDVLDIVLRTNDEPAWSINDIAKQTGIPAKRIRELYASGVERLNQPWVRWYIKKIDEIL